MEYKHLSKRGVLGEGEGWKEDEEKKDSNDEDSLDKRSSSHLFSNAAVPYAT